MANHKKKRAPRQRASSRGCVHFGNGLTAQPLQERRARDSEAAGWPMTHLDPYEAPDDGSDSYEAPFRRAWEDYDIPPSGPMLRENHGRAPKRKPFVIESRWTSALAEMLPGRREWHTHSRYATGAQRAQAFTRLTQAETRRAFGPFFEFRVPEGGPTRR